MLQSSMFWTLPSITTNQQLETLRLISWDPWTNCIESGTASKLSKWICYQKWYLTAHKQSPHQYGDQAAQRHHVFCQIVRGIIPQPANVFINAICWQFLPISKYLTKIWKGGHFDQRFGVSRMQAVWARPIQQHYHWFLLAPNLHIMVYLFLLALVM